MTEVDDHRGVDHRDPFPVGMRVLAVDDDPTCLMILETLLQKCQYHVTTTKNAITALNLLRENKNEFDLVISDVHMPDMDGFKLLELVGLEMDLPVIMLSVNDDPKMVMKGITHGACDYLLKPVRIEALKNIWQHVIRKKKADSKEQNKTSNQDKPDSGSCNEIGSASTENSDQNGRHNKKRKDQDEDSDEDHENGHDNEDPSTQKKPRVVWSVELHRKFVNAVHQLGIDKAVPKKILDLMNVEKLTRENVASHLQKYRLFLKRTSDLANQQANMAAALGSTADQSYLGISPLSGFGHLPALSGSGQFHNNGFRSFSPGGMISRLNTPSGLNLHGFPSSGTLHLNQAQNLNNSTNDQLQFPSALAHGNQDLLSAGHDQWQQNKGVNSVQINLNSLFDGKPSFPTSNRLADQRLKVTISSSSSPILGVSNNALVLEPNAQGTQGSGIYDNPTSVASQHSELSFPLLDHGRCSDIWSSSMQSPGTNSYPSSECFRQSALSPANNNMTSTTFQGANLSGASSITSLSSQSHDSLTDMHSQGLVFTNNPGQTSNNVSFQGWDDHNQNGSYHSNVVGNSINSLTHMNGAIDTQGHPPSNSTFNRNMDFDFYDPLQMKHDGVIDLTEETSLKPLQMYAMNQHKPQNGRVSNNPGSLEDLVSEMMKQKQDKVKFSDEDFIYDNNYSSGTAM